jgi:uncharacterized membrane protein YgdD (TMEM256/DUF423 family)
MNNRFLLLAGLLGFFGVLAGTFGAHGLKGVLDPKPVNGASATAGPSESERAEGRARLETYETGVRYHLIHAVALLALAGIAAGRSCAAVTTAGWAFVLGILVFPGSLYLLALTGQKWLGMIAPIGGAAFMVGWAALLVAGWKGK